MLAKRFFFPFRTNILGCTGKRKRLASYIVWSGNGMGPGWSFLGEGVEQEHVLSRALCYSQQQLLQVH